MLFPRLCRVARLCNSTLRRPRQDVESAWGHDSENLFQKVRMGTAEFSSISQNHWQE